MVKSNKYDNYTKDELIDELETLKKKKYGLVWDKKNSQEILDAFVNWENVPENFIPKQFPVLREIKNKEIKTDKTKPVNLLIEGDNYHSLAVLNFTHQNKIDLIYIDPPYNTGNNDFSYNDKFVDADDPYRHSKWLSFMEKRLKLAKTLLKETGVIFISIDDNEMAQLKLLCDEVFEENNFINVICLKSGRDEGVKMAHKDKRLVKYKEYVLVYAKDKYQVRFTPQYKEKEEWDDRYSSWLDKHNSNDTNRWEIYALSKKIKEVGLDIADDHEILQWKMENRDNIIRLAANSSLAIKATKGNKIIIKLKTPRGLDAFAFNGQKILFASNKVKHIDGSEKLGEYIGDLWDDISYNNLHNEGGVDLPNGKKPIALVKRMLKLAAGQDAIILDFFAGSGTTGHAVAELNQEDGGSRQFILGTNDEELNNKGNTVKHRICTDICYPRMKNINKEVGLNLKYYTCDFVGSDANDKNKRDLVKKSTEMICIKEDIFDLVVDEEFDFKIYQKDKKFLGVVFNIDSLETFKKIAETHKGDFSVYCFSYNETTPEKDFKNLNNKYTFKPIPAIILKVYLEIFKK